jgi:hypothetical protein
VDDTPINNTKASGNPWFISGLTPSYSGSVNSHADIISFGLRYRFAPAAPEPAPLGPVMTRG